jgi:hypothetical protein
MANISGQSDANGQTKNRRGRQPKSMALRSLSIVEAKSNLAGLPRRDQDEPSSPAKLPVAKRGPPNALDSIVGLVFAETRLILTKAQPSEPHSDIDGSRPCWSWLMIVQPGQRV